MPKIVIFHARFQTCPSKIHPVLRPRAEIMSSLLRLERQQKYFLNPLQIRFLSSFICWNWDDRYVNKLPYFPGKPNPEDRNGQSLYPFQIETAQNYTLWGGTYLGGLYKGVTPPPPPYPGMKLPRPMNDGYFDAIHLMSHLIIVWYVPKQQNTFLEAFYSFRYNLRSLFSTST